MTAFLSRLIFKPRAACSLLSRPFNFSALNHVGTSSKNLFQTRSFLVQSSPSPSRLTSAAPTFRSLVSLSPRRSLSTTLRLSYRSHSPPPPRRPQFLGFLNRIPQNTVFFGIICLNSLVFGMWLLAKAEFVRFFYLVYHSRDSKLF